MKHLFVFLAIVFLSITVHAQPKYVKDSEGNYTPVQSVHPHTKRIDKPTGKIFTDAKGVRYQIFLTSTKRLVYYRISKQTGTHYKVYLDAK